MVTDNRTYVIVSVVFDENPANELVTLSNWGNGHMTQNDC